MTMSAYAVLGIPSNADRYDLRKAYRDLVRAVHPDAGGTGDPQQLAAVQAAYRELSAVVPTMRPLRRERSRPRFVDLYA